LSLRAEGKREAPGGWPRPTPWGFALSFVLLQSVVAARAQSAADRVFPPGGQRGTTVTLTFPGMEKVEAATLIVDGEGVAAQGPFVKGVGKVEIAANAAPGVRQVRLVGAATATAPRPFMVGVLPELLEKEPNNTRDRAQPIEKLPVTLSGAIPRGDDVDTYRVALKLGECLVVASESRRLAGPVQLDLRVRDPQGRTVAVKTDVRKRDPVFTCQMPADGEYLLQLCDVTGNMGSVDEGCQYRLHLTTGPWLSFVTPPSVAPAPTTRLALHGWNLDGHTGAGLIPVEQPLPAGAEGTIEVSGGGAPNAVPLRVGTAAESEEVEPNDATESAQPIPLPAAVHGIFGARGDADCFRFTAKAKEKLQIAVQAREWDSLADPRMTMLDGSGKTLFSEDDAERTRDPRTVWTCPADGEYTLVVQDVAGGSRGGPSSYYRVTIGPVTPELGVVAAEPTLTIKPGARGQWALSLYCWFVPEEVTVTVEGLPPGVTVEPVKVKPYGDRSDPRQASLNLTAAGDAKSGFAVVRIVATTANGALAPVEGRWLISGDGGTPLGTGSTTKLVVLVPVP
jgi:hypothetical protein